MGAETNAAVYRALIRDLKRHDRPATVVACISDPVDFAVLNAFHNLGKIRLIPLQQSNKGKRTLWSADWHFLRGVTRARGSPRAYGTATL